MTKPSPQEAKLIPDILRNDLCAGCGGCSVIAPHAYKMEMSSDGFLRPVNIGQVSTEVDNEIAQICPGLGQSLSLNQRSSDPLWGPFTDVYNGWATDSELRHRASSGGALSAILKYLLETKIVDRIVQTAENPDHPVTNMAVLSSTSEQILISSSSRYAPSAPLTALITDLDRSQKHAFVGKPCDIAALKVMMDRDAELAKAIPITLSFFCAGVPSELGAFEILDTMGLNPNDVVSFRYRGMGWPGHATATLKDGTTSQMSYHDSWGGILSKKVQHRCKICADSVGSAADIVCADAWHCDENGYPLFTEAEGVSLIISRTARGQSLLAEATAAGYLQTERFPIAGVASMQPGQVRKKSALAARLFALKLMGYRTPRYRGLQVLHAAFFSSPVEFIRNFLGMIRRRPR